MAARATRSASRKAASSSSSSDDASRCLLLALSHDELGVIVDGLADPLQPVVAAALSSTCLGLRTPLGAVLQVLKERHERALALCLKFGMSCAAMRVARVLRGSGLAVTADDMATLAMIMRTNGLPRMQKLYFYSNAVGDAGTLALCDGLGRGAAPLLTELVLNSNSNQLKVGPVGAEALAAALRRGAWPRLEGLDLGGNPLGSQGVSALAAPLRKRPALRCLVLNNCEIGDEGVASLFANLGKEDFKALHTFWLEGNKITDVGMATLAAAIEAGGLPTWEWHTHALHRNPASAVAVHAVKDALAKRSSQ